MSEIIRFRGVEKAFGAKVIYRGLDLDVRRGEVLTILGGSGVGKSVMLKLLIGLLQVDAGEIFFDGEDITKMNERQQSLVRRRIAMLFQGAALFDSISVGENVAYGLEEHFRHSMSRDAIAERVAWALGLVGLEGIEEMRPSDLSGGMRKRVGLARAIAVRPEVLLYDEPTTGLDPITTRTVDELIVRGREEDGVTSVVVSHDVESAVRIGDLIGLLYEGRIQVVAPPREFLRHTHPVVREFVRGFRPQESST